MTMKAVVLDGYTENPGDLTWDKIKTCCVLTVYDRTPAASIIDRIGNAEIVITNKTPIKKEVLDSCPNIRFISVLSTGFDVVDTKAAEKRGIVVSNVPSYGTATVAQFAISLLLEICHHIGNHSDDVHSGVWGNSSDWCFWNHPLIELSGKTMGIMGLGRIGKATAKIAAGLGMRIIAHDTFALPDDETPVEMVSPDALYSQSDVIVLHCPLTDETSLMINRDSIKLMKDGVIIINNARGALIDEAALTEALNSGKVYAAGLDVVSSEPIDPSNPLLNAKNCIITPHISWATKEARERIMTATYENIKAFLESSPINKVF